MAAIGRHKRREPHFRGPEGTHATIAPPQATPSHGVCEAWERQPSARLAGQPAPSVEHCHTSAQKEGPVRFLRLRLGLRGNGHLPGEQPNLRTETQRIPGPAPGHSRPVGRSRERRTDAVPTEPEGGQLRASCGHHRALSRRERLTARAVSAGQSTAIV